MDHQRRKGGRRGRGHSYANLPSNRLQGPFNAQQSGRTWNFTNSLTSFLILSSLIGVIYLMLDYHCNTCSPKCQLSNVSQCIEQIADNISQMKNNYQILETKLSQFSQELPKMEKQIDILEAFNSIAQKELAWKPKLRLMPPNFDELLQKPVFEEGKNITKHNIKHTTCVTSSVPTNTQEPIHTGQK